jgi:hypothetical protein
VGAAIILADRRKDMTMIKGSFFDYANAPNDMKSEEFFL